MRSAPRSVSVPTASMADLAFLLLVFFLVAASIQSDVGLPVALPPSLSHGAAPVPSLLAVGVTADGDALLDGERVSPGALRLAVAAYAARADRPAVALQAHRRMPYARYVAALDAVLLGHRDAGVEPRLTLRQPAR